MAVEAEEAYSNSRQMHLFPFTNGHLHPSASLPVAVFRMIVQVHVHRVVRFVWLMVSLETAKLLDHSRVRDLKHLSRLAVTALIFQYLLLVASIILTGPLSSLRCAPGETMK